MDACELLVGDPGLGQTFLALGMGLPAAERPDSDFPFVLITGRQLEHWHTGAMTRRAGVLDAIEPEPTVSMNPHDMTAIGLEGGDLATVESRRGKISLWVREDAGTP